MKKLLLILTISILLIGIASAGGEGENIGTFKYNTCIKLPQVCASCSYSTVSAIISPNGTIYAVEQAMTQADTFFSYNFCDTLQLGEYKVNGHFDIDGVDQVFYYFFNISPSGNSGGEYIAFFIIVILLIYGITFMGYFKRDVIITLLGCLACMGLGIYLFNNGVIIFRDDITRIISYTTLGLGAAISSMIGIAYIQENMN